MLRYMEQNHATICKCVTKSVWEHQQINTRVIISRRYGYNVILVCKKSNQIMLYVDKRLCEQRTINYENVIKKGRKTKVVNAYPCAVQMRSRLG